MSGRERLSITIIGKVQGVGFRPFVYNLATRLRLAGSVINRSGSVLIEIEGDELNLREFRRALQADAPLPARIDRLVEKYDPPRGETGFRIGSSTTASAAEVFVAPDTASCPECLRELFDPSNRRYRYPFLNCVSCGPRLTIIESVPYDRERTTLRAFPLCEACRDEFEDPRDRRFHAQAIACPACGPGLFLLDANGISKPSVDPLREAALQISNGRIVALQGLGGFHLACDARNAQAVTRLRTRKHREEKPFALMVVDAAAACDFCEVSEQEKLLLEGPERPIVLLGKREGASGAISGGVADGITSFGVMLPSTPLHYLLFDSCGRIPLVMTSGNDSGCPIVSDQHALSELIGIADLFVSHDRPIALRCDDSVVRAEKKGTGAVHFLRRSRGYAPEPVLLPKTAEVPILALGAQLKNTFALAIESRAILSHYIGDLANAAVYEAYEREILHYEGLFSIKPRVLVHDLHPDYLSSQYAEIRASLEGLRRIRVQHHHAHLCSCMAENGLDEEVIGVIFDGTGYGVDGRIWGGEFLLGSYLGFQRMAHLKYVPMPGGEAAIREPWRMALAHLLGASIDPIGGLPGVSKTAIRVARQMIEREVRVPQTSSMGRLFDSVASLIGLRHVGSYEGQAAIELEALASRVERASIIEENLFNFEMTHTGGSPIQIDAAPVIASVFAQTRNGENGPVIARRFHVSVAEMISTVCGEIGDRSGLRKVVLSGGVFMNALLLDEAKLRLRKRGFEVFWHRTVPTNDGGISLGQLAAAAAMPTKEEWDVSGDSWESG